jgi:hypothetical protein
MRPATEGAAPRSDLGRPDRGERHEADSNEYGWARTPRRRPSVRSWRPPSRRAIAVSKNPPGPILRCWFLRDSHRQAALSGHADGVVLHRNPTEGMPASGSLSATAQVPRWSRASCLGPSPRHQHLEWWTRHRDPSPPRAASNGGSSEVRLRSRTDAGGRSWKRPDLRSGPIRRSGERPRDAGASPVDRMAEREGASGHRERPGGSRAHAAATRGGFEPSRFDPRDASPRPSDPHRASLPSVDPVTFYEVGVSKTWSSGLGEVHVQRTPLTSEEMADVDLVTVAAPADGDRLRILDRAFREGSTARARACSPSSVHCGVRGPARYGKHGRDGARQWRVDVGMVRLHLDDGGWAAGFALSVRDAGPRGLPVPRSGVHRYSKRCRSIIRLATRPANGHRPR